MYPAVYAKNGQLKHSGQCNMAYGRKDENCPRCVELIQGAPARGGWQNPYFQRKKQEDEARLNQIRTHNCKQSNCGYVCTAFEW